MYTQMQKETIRFIIWLGVGIVAWFLVTSADGGERWADRITVKYNDGTEQTWVSDGPPHPSSQPATKPAKTILDYPLTEWEAFKDLYNKDETYANYKLIIREPHRFGVKLSGTGNVVRDIEVEGAHEAIKIIGATSAKVDGLVCSKGQYGIFLEANGTLWNSGVTLTNINIDATGGMHALRVYATKDLFVDGFEAVQNGPYDGACLNIRQGINIRLKNVKTGGAHNADGFGPDPKNHNEDTWTLDGLTIDTGELNNVRPFEFYARCNGFEFKNLVMRQHGQHPVISVSDYASGTFKNIKFEGGTKLYETKPKHVTFENCTYNGVPIQ